MVVLDVSTRADGFTTGTVRCQGMGVFLQDTMPLAGPPQLKMGPADETRHL
jgi:hypothetical protein